MWHGIEAVKPGRPLSDIGRAIENHAKKYKLRRGQGVHRPRHRRAVPHRRAGAALLRRAGQHDHAPRHDVHDRADDHLGTWQHKMVFDDDWTAATADGKRTAQFEHTVLVTDDGVEVLTAGAGRGVALGRPLVSGNAR
jgi:methionyl aminopeptidase